MDRAEQFRESAPARMVAGRRQAGASRQSEASGSRACLRAPAIGRVLAGLSDELGVSSVTLVRWLEAEAVPCCYPVEVVGKETERSLLRQGRKAHQALPSVTNDFEEFQFNALVAAREGSRELAAWPALFPVHCQPWPEVNGKLRYRLTVPSAFRRRRRRRGLWRARRSAVPRGVKTE